jgi:PKD repeat protein
VSEVWESVWQQTSTGVTKEQEMVLMSFGRWFLIGVLVISLIIPVVSATVFTNYTVGAMDGSLGITNHLGPTFFDLRVHNGGTATTDAATARTQLYANTSDADTYITLYRSYLQFDTSGLPDDAIIDSVNVSIQGITPKTTQLGSPTYYLTGFVPGTNGTSVASDFQTRQDVALSDAISSASWSTSARNNFTLNAAGLANVSKIAYTNFMVRSSWDVTNNTTGLTWGTDSHSDIFWNTSEAAVNTPFIEVTYHTGDAPVSAFTCTPRYGKPPLSVTCTDSSTNTPTSWSWAYKNATAGWTQFNTSQNPVVSLPIGVYDINLTATNADGSDDEIKTSYIEVPTWYDYVAYGDSITNWNPNYVKLMTMMYARTKTSNSSSDGASQQSDWGLANLERHRNGDIVYVMFGINDMDNGVPANDTATNLKGIYNQVLSNGSTPYILIHTPMDNAGFFSGTFADQLAEVNAIQVNLTANSIPFIKAYDAVDTIPCNGVYDPIDPLMVSDGVHMNGFGHSQLAQYVWNSTKFCEDYAGASGTKVIIYPEMDGYFTLSTEDTWANQRAATTATSVDTASDNFVIRKRSTTVEPIIDRWSSAALSFNTSNKSLIPANATITGAKLRLSGKKSSYTYNYQTIGVVGGVLANNASLATGDYDGGLTSEFATRLHPDQNYANMNYTFNSSGVAYIQANLGGTTHTVLYLKDGWDLDNASPTFVSEGFANTIVNSSESAIVASRPYLEIIYTAPAVPDTTAPASITGLTNGTVTNNSIMWQWTNPTDTDFNHTVQYKNNVLYYNSSNTTTAIIWTGLTNNTAYTISTHTVDLSGNMNSTWVNATATTNKLADPVPVVTAPKISTTGASNDIVAALNIGSILLIVVGIILTIAGLMNVSGGRYNSGTTALFAGGIISIVIGAILLFITYLILSPLLNILG